MAIHKKTGNRYVIIGIAKNANNGEEEYEPVVVYERRGKLFVRSLIEFKSKFAPESEREGNAIWNAERGE